MAIEKFTADTEKRILQGLATDLTVLSRLSSKWDGKMGPLSSNYANLIGSWCVDHFNQFSTVPKADLRIHFERWAANKSAEEVSAVERLLTWQHHPGWEEGPEISSDQLVVLAIDHINAVKVQKLLEQANLDLKSGQLNKALQRITSFTQEEIGQDGCEDILNSEEEIDDTFAETETKSLINFEDGPEHNGLRKFFGSELSLGTLFAFRGPEKSGKTFLLVEMAVQALFSRRRVAFFEVGDMSRRQIKKRIMTRISGKPIKGEFPCTIPYPTSIRKPRKNEQTGVLEVPITYNQLEFKEPLDREEARRACRNVMRHRVYSKKTFFKLCSYHNFTCSVSDIQSKLTAWRLAGWVPEIVIVDYADILAMSSRLDFRQSVNQTWGRLRRLSEENNCCLITATQADSESYRKEIQDMQNFSEDKRQNAHVNGIIGINSNPRDKEQGLIRLNWVGGREVPWSSKRCCYLATCLALANPAVCSYF